ncbi:MAG: mechanosensitive ion channel [Candidatus Omnitrophica bacterium]|nr:mechanosensitive ion channel [Candidatus Omnitrophota bacterium]
MEELINKMYEYVALYGMNLVAALLIFVIGKWLARVISNVFSKIMEKAKVEPTLVTFIKNLSYTILLVFVIIAALSKLGVETTSFIAVLGAAGLAVGLALQGSLANFAAGVLLIMFKPFKVGDLVQICGHIGVVKEIHIFNTIIHTPDNQRKIIPNASVTGDTITNLSAVDMRRVDLVFGISYNDNIKTAKEALERVVVADPRVLKDPAPTIAVSELGDSSVNLVCRPWCKPTDYWGVFFDITEKGKIELEKSGITIPFPQRDVHMFQEK